MLNNSFSAYVKMEKMTSTPRETEAWVLTKGAAKLKKCIDNWEQKGTQRNLYQALIYNKKIWTLFQSELSKQNSPQPVGIRRNLLILCTYINKQIRSAMAEPSRAKLASIIEINMIIARGLGMSPKPNPVKESAVFKRLTG